jgi:hypothetical protein
MAAGFTGSANVTELIPEITLQVDYIYHNMSLGRSLVNFQDVSGLAGNVVEFPRFTEVSASTGVAETATPTSHQMDLAMPTLTIAKRSVYVPTGDLAMRTAGNLAQNIGYAIGIAQVKAVDALIFGVLTATTNWTTGTGGTNAALTLTNIQTGLNLLEKNEVDDQIYGVLHPHQWNAVRAFFTLGDTLVSNPATDEIIKRGVGNFYGVEWFQSARIGSGTVNATASVYNGLLFSKRGIGYAYAGLKGLESIRGVEAVDHLILNWADSAGVVYDSAVCKLYSTSA